MQGCTTIIFAKKWDYGKVKFESHKVDKLIAGVKLHVDDYLTTFPNSYDGKN